MDSLTQIVLGGAVGEAVLGKKVGNKAVLWGAIGGTIPDLDTIPGQFLDTVSRLEIHRGFSHSIVFAVLIAPLLGFLIQKLYRKKEATVWAWTQLFFWSIFTHPLLDIFTTWGTQLFWPWDWRIAMQSIFVIDPIYTLPFLICLISLLFFNRKSQKRRSINRFGLIVSSLYLAYSVGIKLYIDSIFESELKKDKVSYLRFDSRPTPFNTILWTSNIETENEFLITYYSLLDSANQLSYIRFPKNDKLLLPYRNDPQIERLIHLTKGFYTIEKTEKGIAMNDLRFGITDAFEENGGNFVFTYLINHTENGIEVKEKPRDLSGTKKNMLKLWERIKGVKT